MIPKIFHRIWFGKQPMPPAYQKYWEAWQRQFPQHQFITWRDEDIEKLPLTRQKICESTNAITQSDVARYEILYTIGGIYIDCDMMPFHHFSCPLFRSSLVVCNEIKENKYCSNSFIASEAGHPALKWAVDTLIKKELGREPPNHETGPYFLRKALKHGPYQELPTDAFYPYLYNEPLSTIFSKDLSQTYAIHIWGAAWFNTEQTLQKALQRLQKGDIEECRSILENLESKEAWMLRSYCDTIEGVREEILRAAKHPAGLRLSQECSSASPFHFLKVAFFLLQQNPEAIVWQIGAGDGILADPLRPLLVNFDPHALLLEPNPYLYKDLKRNYAKNQHAKLIDAALGLSKGKMVLNAVNPVKVIDKGLPDWARGVSSIYQNKIKTNPEKAQLIMDCIEQIDVNTLTIEELLQETQGKEPSIFVLDVEGMDDLLLKEAIKKGLEPEIIHYETQNITQLQKEEIEELLKDKYILVKYVNDMAAYKKEFFSSYCDFLYIQYGISTVYTDAIEIIAGMRNERTI